MYFVNSDSQSVHLTYRKPTCKILHSLCHHPRQAPYTPNIPHTLSHDLRQECYRQLLSHPRIRNEESSGIHWCFQFNLVIYWTALLWFGLLLPTFFFYFNFYVEPWDRETVFKWPLSRKGQEGAKGFPLNRGSVAGEFTDNFVHPSN